jgi:hypothetical protein
MSRLPRLNRRRRPIEAERHQAGSGAGNTGQGHYPWGNFLDGCESSVLCSEHLVDRERTNIGPPLDAKSSGGFFCLSTLPRILAVLAMAWNGFSAEKL